MTTEKRKRGRPRKQPVVVAQRKRGRPRKNPVAVEVPYFAATVKRKPGRPPAAVQVHVAPSADYQPVTARTSYVYRPGINGHHYIDAQSIAVHAVTPVAKAASRSDAEYLVRILNGERA